MGRSDRRSGRKPWIALVAAGMFVVGLAFACVEPGVGVALCLGAVMVLIFALVTGNVTLFG